MEHLITYTHLHLEVQACIAWQEGIYLQLVY